MKRRFQRGLIWILSVTVPMLVTACGIDPTNGPAGAPLPSIAEANALSNHYVEVTFSRKAFDAAEDPENYVITAPDARRLSVRSADLSADRMKAVLTTDAQEDVPYTLAVAPTADASGGSGNQAAARAGFNGSMQPEPELDTAISLGPTSVLLTLSERMDKSSTENIAFYRIFAANDATPREDVADVDIVDAVLEPSQITVVLTTSPQTNIEYTVKVTNASRGPGPFLVDPTQNEKTFFGIPPDDPDPPQLLKAEPTSDSTVLLTFSEPLNDEADDPVNFSISPLLVVTGAQLTLHNTQILLFTLPQVAGVEYTVEVFDVFDIAGNLIDPNADSARFSFVGTPNVTNSNTLPRVVAASSTSNTTVTVVFNKAMGDSAEEAGNYLIVQSNVVPEAGALGVTGARFLGPDRTAVEVTTLSQSTVQYDLIAVNVKDLAGNQLGPRLIAEGVLVDPTRVILWGNGPVGDPIDTDGDGLPDNEEQLGWVVTIVMSGGNIVTRDVTSDPFVADTDGDGLSDLQEQRRASDPRDLDSDADTIPDAEELALYYSSLINQDSDGDGVNDKSELFFKTALIHADTDGDGFSDSEELFQLSRDPRVADLPQPRIEIGDTALRLDTRFSFTDTQGVSRTSDESVSTSLQQSESTSFSFSDTSTTTIAVEAGAEFSNETTTSVGHEPGTKSKTGSKKSLGFSFTQEFQSTVTRESSRGSQQAYERSLGTSETFDDTQEVTREVVGASMDVTVTIANIGDLAFTMTNLEVTGLQQDPVDRSRFVPIATLVPASQLITGEIPAFTSGPFIPERGPFIFRSRDVFPSMIEDLMKNPRGLLFRVANFDVVDEFGRNFAFVAQEVNDKTVGLTMDFGNSRVERFRVATYNSFNPDGAFDEVGKPRGIRMADALQDVLGMRKNGPPDAITVGKNGCGETWAIGDDVQLFDPICVAVIRSDGVLVLPGPNGVLNSAPRGDDEIDLLMVGHCTDNVNLACTDDGFCGGTCEGLQATEVIVDGGDGCAQSIPRRDDLAAVLVSGGEERVQQMGCVAGGLDGEIILGGPNGVLDSLAARDDQTATITGYGTQMAGVCDGNADVPGRSCVLDAQCPNGACKLEEKLVRINGIVDEIVLRCDGDSVPNAIGRICTSNAECGVNGKCVEILDRFWMVIGSADFEPGADFDDIRLHAGDRISLAYVQDTDGDGLLRREEFLFGSSDLPPRGVNSDGCPFLGTAAVNCFGLTFDSVGDFDEVRRGWEVSVVGPPSYFAFADPTVPDSDLDRLFDDEEQLHGTDPRKRDTDDDGVTDFSEIVGYRIFDRDNEVVGQVPVYVGEVILDGGNGIADSTAGPGDVQVVAFGRFVGGRCKDSTDNAIREPTAGGNGTADSMALVPSDDIQEIPFGDPATAGVIIISPGPNGILETSPGDVTGDGIFDGGDDVFGDHVECSLPDHSECVGGGTCVPLPGGVVVSSGDDLRITTMPNNPAPLPPSPSGDDFVAQFHEGRFASDPLNRDTDGDTLFDGVEARLGSLGANPNDPTDAADFRDDDRDGLVNKQERDGWVPVYEVDPPSDVCRDAFGEEWDVPNPLASSKDLRIAHPQCVVRSDTFEPDSDFDGLPDLFEHTFNTNPKDRDTDHDGLLDFDEVDPESSFSVDIPDFRDFENECFEQDRCFYDSDGSLLYGTDPKKVDTDGDTRSDLQELLEPWTVNVFGEDAYTVFSSPVNDDIDVDSLSDSVEFTAGTDPAKADTDGDGVPDDRDTVGILGTNPLIPDQKVRVAVTSITVIGDCDPSDAGGDFQGKIQVQQSGVAAVELIDLDECCDEAAGVEEGQTKSFPVASGAVLIIEEGDTIILFSNGIEEWDEFSGNEQLGSFSRTFAHPVRGRLEIIDLMEEDSSCQLRIIVDVSWLR